MKLYMLIYIPIIILLSLFSGCKDIITTDPNIIATPIDSNKKSSEPINFLFFNANIYYHFKETVATWNVIKPSDWEKGFNIFNNSKNQDFIITSIALVNGKDYTLTSSLPLPIVLKPGEMNYLKAFYLKLRTRDLNYGIYEDKIIINNNENYVLTVRTKVY